MVTGPPTPAGDVEGGELHVRASDRSGTAPSDREAAVATIPPPVRGADAERAQHQLAAARLAVGAEELTANLGGGPDDDEAAAAVEREARVARHRQRRGVDPERGVERPADEAQGADVQRRRPRSRLHPGEDAAALGVDADRRVLAADADELLGGCGHRPLLAARGVTRGGVATTGGPSGRSSGGHRTKPVRGGLRRPWPGLSCSSQMPALGPARRGWRDARLAADARGSADRHGLEKLVRTSVRRLGRSAAGRSARSQEPAIACQVSGRARRSLGLAQGPLPTAWGRRCGEGRRPSSRADAS